PKMANKTYFFIIILFNVKIKNKVILIAAKPILKINRKFTKFLRQNLRKPSWDKNPDEKYFRLCQWKQRRQNRQFLLILQMSSRMLFQSAFHLLRGLQFSWQLRYLQYLRQLRC